MAKTNPIGLKQVPCHERLLTDESGKLYYLHDWNKHIGLTTRPLIKDVVNIQLYSLDDKHYVAKLTFKDSHHKRLFEGSVSGILGNPWRINNTNSLRLKKKESEFVELFDLILERLELAKTKAMEKEFYKLLGKIDL